MWAFQVVPREPAQQFEVEIGRVIEEQQVVVVVDAFLLHGTVEALAVRVHAWRFGKGMPVSKQAISERSGEMALEFAAVVGEHGFDGKREHRLNQAKELCRRGAGVTAGGPRPGEMGVQIGAGDDEAALVERTQLDAVQRHAVARTLGTKVLGLAQARLAHRFGFARAAEGTWSRTHLVGSVGDEAADGARARTAQLLRGGERRQQLMQPLFSPVRMRGAQAPNLGDYGHRPLRRRRRLGAVDPGARAATLPPWALSLVPHRIKVRRLSSNASQAAETPWRCAKLRICNRRCASGQSFPA